jgi:ATP-binding cassette subfamily E protein 1
MAKGSGSKRAAKKDGKADMTRIAVVNPDRCKPKKCTLECKRACPMNRTGAHCVEADPSQKIAFISEELCIGCNICVKKCPFEAITIINLPSNLSSEVTHRFGENGFKLHRLPTPRPGQVLGLVGTNGIGKSTALKILAAKLKPNLGVTAEGDAPEWHEICARYRGSELQNYFQLLLDETITAVVKPQYVETLARALKSAVVVDQLRKIKQRDILSFLGKELELLPILKRKVKDLSGGELQRFAIAMTAVLDRTMYMFDEPSSYLDIKQRLSAGRVIRSIVAGGDSLDKYVLVVEHDLAVLDYLSDHVCMLYGRPGVYGVVTLPFSVREGINVFLGGFIPTENTRFRDEALTFAMADASEEQDLQKDKHFRQFSYPAMHKRFMDAKAVKDKDGQIYMKETPVFTLHIEEGSFTDSEIIVLLGENGTGKTTFVKMLAGLLPPDKDPDTDEYPEVPELNISFKPQTIAPSFAGTVQQLLNTRLKTAWQNPSFMSDVVKPMQLERLMDRTVTELSGGELQRVAITMALGKAADIYLLDEPSAYLDVEQRVTTGKVIRRFIMHAKRTAFIVEHDFLLACYLADRVIVYSGNPGVEATAHTPQGIVAGMNAFLESIEVTFRRDPTNFRPRINKFGSQKDQEQKLSGSYFSTSFVEDEL